MWSCYRVNIAGILLYVFANQQIILGPSQHVECDIAGFTFYSPHHALSDINSLGPNDANMRHHIKSNSGAIFGFLVKFAFR